MKAGGRPRNWASGSGTKGSQRLILEPALAQRRNSGDRDRRVRATTRSPRDGLRGDHARALGGADPGRGRGTVQRRVRGVGRRSASTFAPDGGESGVAVLARALPVIREIVTRHAGERVLVVSHKATIRLIPQQPPRLRRARLPRPAGSGARLSQRHRFQRRSEGAPDALQRHVPRTPPQPRTPTESLSKWWDQTRPGGRQMTRGPIAAALVLSAPAR